jgi:hypothetical protein
MIKYNQINQIALKKNSKHFYSGKQEYTLKGFEKLMVKIFFKIISIMNKNKKPKSNQ